MHPVSAMRGNELTCLCLHHDYRHSAASMHHSAWEMMNRIPVLEFELDFPSRLTERRADEGAGTSDIQRGLGRGSLERYSVE